MVDSPLGFTHSGLLCYQDSEDPSRFWYVPESPRPDTGTARPCLLGQGKGLSFLALEAAWLPTAEAVGTLEAEILHRHPDLDPLLLEIAPAPPPHLQVESMILELVEEDGSRTELARSSTSGMPPYRAVFSVTLSESQARRVGQALAGTEQLLFLTLRHALTIPVQATAEVSGYVPAPTTAQLAAPGGADPAAALRAARADGTLTATVTTLPAGVFGIPLGEHTLAAALENARLLLAADFRQRAPQPGRPAASTFPDRIPLSVHESESRRIRLPTESWLVASTDLGTWAANQQRV